MNLIISFLILLYEVSLMKLILIKKRSLLIIFALVLVTLSGAVFTADRVVEAMAAKRHVPICCVETQEKKIALTFDLTENSDTEKTVKSLKGEKATFFVSEDCFEKNPQNIKKLCDNGYEIQLLEEELKGKTKNEIYDRLAQRIERTALVIEKNCDKVRFYQNLYDNNSVKAIYSLGLYPVQWSADSSAEYFSAGDIIRADEDTDIEGLITSLKNDGYVFVTVSELFYKDNYRIDVNGVQISE